eukprot:scaffold256624_cov18-Tisochrysis_lutea.AAC.1
MHAAAYALDPQFLFCAEGELDEATMEGLSAIFDRLCLRDAILAAADPEKAWQEYTFHTPEVVARVAQVERELS